MTAVPAGTTVKQMADYCEELVAMQTEETTPMQMHLTLWDEEADEYTSEDHKLMIAVAEELVRREEGAG